MINMTSQKELQEKIERNDREIKALHEKRDKLEEEIIDAYSSIKVYIQRLENLEKSNDEKI
jgi:chromosome segregation ATPase